MESRELGRSGLKVGRLALGTMNFGSDWHGIGAVDEKAADRILGTALDAGVDLIDTADVYGYGEAETMLGRLLKGGRRQKVRIATKVFGHMRPGDPSSGGLSRRHIESALEDSLRRLGTDRVDLYMPHAVDPEVPLDESLEAFAAAVRSGKVRVLGCSNFGAPEWDRALWSAARAGQPRFEFNQVQYSLASPWAGPEHSTLCRLHGVSLMAWSPLGGGFLSGKYEPGQPRPTGRRKDPARAFPYLPEGRLIGLIRLLEKAASLEGLTMSQTSVGWLMSKPEVACVVLGARSAEQLSETLASRPLSTDAVSLLDRAAEVLTRG